MELEITQRKLGFFVRFFWDYDWINLAVWYGSWYTLVMRKGFHWKMHQNCPNLDGMFCFGMGLAIV
jgi:hypothetical protein